MDLMMQEAEKKYYAALEDQLVCASIFLPSSLCLQQCIAVCVAVLEAKLVQGFIQKWKGELT